MAFSGRELAFLWTGLSCLLPPVLILPAVLLSPVCASVPTSSLSVSTGPAPTQHSHSLSESSGHLTPVRLVKPSPVHRCPERCRPIRLRKAAGLTASPSPTLREGGHLASGPSPCAGLPLPEALLPSSLAYLSAFLSHLQGQVADCLVLTGVNTPDVGTLTWTGLRKVGHSCN